MTPKQSKYDTFQPLSSMLYEKRRCIWPLPRQNVYYTQCQANCYKVQVHHKWAEAYNCYDTIFKIFQLNAKIYVKLKTKIAKTKLSSLQ